jgi:DUF971 family protein
MIKDYRPTGVKADRATRRVSIAWRDGHTRSYSFDGLRIACPCAECKGGHANMGTITPPFQVQNAPNTGIGLERIEPMGSYALMLVWSDGHSTGMYTWELLRALGPA